MPERSDRSAPPEVVLSPREHEVLTLLSYGRSGAEIAAELVVTEHTVKTHLKHLYKKFGVRNGAQAVRVGFELELLTPYGVPRWDGPRGVVAPERPSARPVVDWQERERARIAADRVPRPLGVRHIGACEAAQSCPCRSGSTWFWPEGQVFADPVASGPGVSR